MSNRAPALFVTLGLLSLFPPEVPGQERPREPGEFTIEASPFRGSVGWARAVAPGRLLGLELGVGVPQVDRTLHPGKGRRSDTTVDDPAFEELLHLGAFLRLRPHSRMEVDAGLRVGLADLWECTASDCWPAGWAGGYLQPMVGGDRWKVGTRLVAGRVGEAEEGGPDSATFAVALTPLVVRLTLRR